MLLELWFVKLEVCVLGKDKVRNENVMLYVIYGATVIVGVVEGLKFGAGVA